MLGWHVSESSLSFLGLGDVDDDDAHHHHHYYYDITRSKEGMLRRGIRIVGTGW